MPHFHHIFNLIKYDLKFVYKQLIVFYIIIVSCAIIARLTNVEDPSFLIKFLHEFTQGATLGFSFGSIVNATMRLWARFRSSLYGDESYLTHTLPVSKSALWTSKFLTSVIITFCNGLIILLGAAILYLPIDYRSFGIYSEDACEFWKNLISLIVLVFLQVVFIIQSGFTGILIGHLANNRRMILSVLAGFGVYILGGVTVLSLCLGWAKINHSVDLITHGQSYEIHEFIMNDEDRLAAVRLEYADITQFFCGIGLFYMTVIAVDLFANYKILAHGVNVD